MPNPKPIAMIPPVDVPQIKSKYSFSFIGSPFSLERYDSKSVRNLAGIIPLIPPPSIDNILNSFMRLGLIFWQPLVNKISSFLLFVYLKNSNEAN
jgi:hypothetical protein